MLSTRRQHFLVISLSHSISGSQIRAHCDCLVALPSSSDSLGIAEFIFPSGTSSVEQAVLSNTLEHRPLCLLSHVVQSANKQACACLPCY